jgi:hypothetical protein
MSYCFVFTTHIFLNLEALDLYRWIHAKEKNEYLEKYLVTFGKEAEPSVAGGFRKRSLGAVESS